jgi:chromosome segregation ATPase
MAISAVSSSAISSYAQGSQFQLLQAQRNADQAEQSARALKSKAGQAETDAERARENARNLQVQAQQAQADAQDARQSLSAVRSLGEARQGLNDLQQQVRSIHWSSENPTAAVSSTTVPTASSGAVVNVQGQTTGTLINVTA